MLFKPEIYRCSLTNLQIEKNGAEQRREVWVRIGRNKYRGGACGQVMDDLPKSTTSTSKIENRCIFKKSILFTI